MDEWKRKKMNGRMKESESANGLINEREIYKERERDRKRDTKRERYI